MKSLDVIFPKKTSDSEIAIDKINCGSRGIIFAYRADNSLAGIILRSSDTEEWLFYNSIDVDGICDYSEDISVLMTKNEINYLKFTPFE